MVGVVRVVGVECHNLVTFTVHEVMTLYRFSVSISSQEGFTSREELAIKDQVLPDKRKSYWRMRRRKIPR